MFGEKPFKEAIVVAAMPQLRAKAANADSQHPKLPNQKCENPETRPSCFRLRGQGLGLYLIELPQASDPENDSCRKLARVCGT